MCILCTQTHETIPMICKGQPVEIDRGIAKLIEKVWQQGIDTDGSCGCSGAGVKFGLATKPTAYVGCASRIDAMRFLKIAAGEKIMLELKQCSSPDLAPYLHLSNGWAVRWTIFNDSNMVEFPPEEITTITAKFAAAEGLQ